MKKITLILCLVMVGSLMFSTVASAGGVRRHTKPGYAVRDDNTAKEIQAIKLAINSLGQEVKMISADRGNTGLEARVAFLEREYSKLNSRLNNQNIIILALLVLLIVLGGYVLMGGKKKQGPVTPQERSGQAGA